MGRKAYFSKRVYKNALAQNHVDSIRHALFVFNQAKHYSFSTNVKELRSGKSKRDGVSLHVHVKKKFELNDYYTNSIVQEVKALLKSQKELQKLYMSNKKEQIKSVKKKIKTTKSKLTSLRKVKTSIAKGKINLPGNLKHIQQHGNLFGVHYKNETLIFFHVYSFEHAYIDSEISKLKSRLGRLEFRLDRLEKMLCSLKGNIHNVVFGTKKLFRSQFTLDTYKNNHDLWKQDWTQSRYNQMTISGRKDAKSGNFVFHYNPKTHQLTFQTPDGTIVHIEDLVFPYGQEQIDSAVEKQMNLQSKDRKLLGKSVGWSIEDKGDYYIFKCLLDIPTSEYKNHSKADGLIGVDCNVDHFAVSNVNHKGQFVNSFVLDFDLVGKSSNQVTKILEAEAIAIVDYAVNHHKGIAVEKLDTTKSKVSNPYGNKKANMRMSLFAYRKMVSAIKSRAEKLGIEVHEVNPAYTSQIGKMKYMKRFGISIHQAASYVIARRAMGYKEKLPPMLHSLVPEKKQGLHHWAQWNAVSRLLSDVPTFWFGHLELSDIVRLRDELSSLGFLLESKRRKDNLTKEESGKSIA
ncbi:IS200/IS605 family accessory protein TnpB-related protein [Radiobacillus kanasensis]|uniref:IS200/IS605 family accessory protein TnpB-related protein n=1 Tax=Radiobacillus kanasensis TaxID=2844358 RepID=UPI001E4FBC1B|nr:IS200/IS605 family accessory protein TnpB-related protein [Radiobacillus kanasensis]UFT99794.1 IS200/IS605 family accessory protein TnpB-related protein [Radiobacillus kanasensis]